MVSKKELLEIISKRLGNKNQNTMKTKKLAEEIIAKKFSKTIEQVNDSEPFYIHQGEAIELMEEYATENDWIKCSDRLPEVNVPVLIYIGDISRNNYQINHISKYLHNQWADIVYGTVTHWCYLPSTPLL